MAYMGHMIWGREKLSLSRTLLDSEYLMVCKYFIVLLQKLEIVQSDFIPIWSPYERSNL